MSNNYPIFSQFPKYSRPLYSWPTYSITGRYVTTGPPDGHSVVEGGGGGGVGYQTIGRRHPDRQFELRKRILEEDNEIFEMLAAIMPTLG